MMLRVLTLLSVALPLAGCPTDPPSNDGGVLDFPDCEAIVDACHEPDEAGGGGMIGTCHDLAHDADSNDDCAPLRAECVSVCMAFDGGVPDDAGTPEDAEAHDEDADHEH
jgi:hypothetical protein